MKIKFGVAQCKRQLPMAVAVLLFASATFAQQGIPSRTQASAQDSGVTRHATVSELARENYEHVAASVIDIKDALLGNSGLMLELKKLIAKEASDNGQVVNEDDLTDQAVNDRLVTDVVFRAAATRLLQRYGYLLPKINPESDAGKEQEFVLKERARHLVQIESQEDNESLQGFTSKKASQPLSPCRAGDDLECSSD